MKCLIAMAAEKFPEAPYLIKGTRRLSFAECHRLISTAAGALAARGIGPGDRIAVLCSPSLRSVLLLHGLFRAGAAAFLLNPATPGAELKRLLALSRVKTVVSDVPQAPLVLKDVVKLSPGAGATKPDLAEIDCNREATLILTSGSSGKPKAVVHTYCQHGESAAACNANLPLCTGNRWLLNLPLYHVSGLSILFRCASAAAAVVIPERNRDISTLPGREAITHVSMVGAQLYRLLEDETAARKTPSLHALLLGGGPLPPSLIEGGLAAGLPLLTTYGSTEMASQICTTPPGAVRENLMTAGRPLKNRLLKVSPGGEILVKGPSLAKGILGARGEITGLRDARGWFHTGDLGRIDGQGRLIVTGRKDNMFISGGENIHPEEIETVMLDKLGLTAVVVAPVPHPEFGARPAAFIKPAKGKTLPDPESVKKALLPFLAPFKIPHWLLAWPKNLAAGTKPARRHFQELAQKLKAP